MGQAGTARRISAVIAPDAVLSRQPNFELTGTLDRGPGVIGLTVLQPLDI